MDASAMYAMIFGSELFESIIGELSVATHVKQMIDPDGDTSTELLGFKQRKREVQCDNVQAPAKSIHSPAIPVIHNLIV